MGYDYKAAARFIGQRGWVGCPWCGQGVNASIEAKRFLADFLSHLILGLPATVEGVRDLLDKVSVEVASETFGVDSDTWPFRLLDEANEQGRRDEGAASR